MSKYKTWGKYTQQTVSKNKDNQRLFVIRSGQTRITVRFDEMDSLIVAMLGGEEMREIKFRAWDKKSSEFITDWDTGDYSPVEISSGFAEALPKILCDECINGEHVQYEDYKRISDIELMQYTGLKDKNGKEIYEGDLLAFEAWEWYRPEVVKKDYVFEVSQAESGEWVGAGICTEWATYCEVVGNIYESPELLEAE